MPSPSHSLRAGLRTQQSYPGTRRRDWLANETLPASHWSRLISPGASLAETRSPLAGGVVAGAEPESARRRKGRGHGPESRRKRLRGLVCGIASERHARAAFAAETVQTLGALCSLSVPAGLLATSDLEGRNAACGGRGEEEAPKIQTSRRARGDHEESPSLAGESRPSRVIFCTSRPVLP